MKVPSDRRSSADAHYAPYPQHPAAQSYAPPPPALSSSRSSAILEETDSTQYKVARAISSCTRCRNRKQKCDGKLPACSACEKAKVECIGFDAISKTNISRNYLYSLEQEVASLRAQVAALTSDDSSAGIGFSKRSMAATASEALAGFRSTPSEVSPRPSPIRTDVQIDPMLQADNESPMRSPWDSPGYSHTRRHSDYFPPAGGGMGVPPSPRSATYVPSRLSLPQTSLGRMVHDAALRTGHANDHIAVLNNRGPAHSGTGTSLAGSAASDRGSHDSPYHPDGELPSPVNGSASASGSQTGRRGPTSPLVKSKLRREFAVPPLPPQPAVERLVAAYVDFIGVTAPIIHIPTLGRQLTKIREGHDVEQSDVFVVMMVMALSTMASSRFVDPPDELRAASEAFHAEAMKHLDAVFEEQSYVGLQAILLLVWYSLLNPDKGSIWFLVGLAARTCVDLGYHNENNIQDTNIDALEMDMRRRLFWITYKMDRLLCQALGRPPTIPNGYVNVGLPSPLHDMDIVAARSSDPPLSGEPCAYKAVFIHTLHLRVLQSEIMANIYGIYDKQMLPDEQWFESMFERVKEWFASCPEPRGTVSSEGYAISYHNTALLLFRPSPGNPRPGKEALTTVVASSSYIIRIYRRMQLNNRISWMWLTSHFTFMSGLSFLYAFYNLYSVSGAGSGIPTMDEANLDIESCLAVLDYLSSRVPSAGACHDTMQTVSKAIMDKLSSNRSGEVTDPHNRGVFGRTPVSSSREDPLPNPAFPAPLPAVTLPYELSLLDNLFVNPMASHPRASAYTEGNKDRAEKMANRMRSTINSTTITDSWGAPPQGLPPNAFQGPGGAMPQINGYGHSPMSAYAVAAQVRQPQDPMTQGMARSFNPQVPQSVSEDQSAFDIFNFLLDEEGGLGNAGNWDSLEIPSDMSLWT